jgi:hypothetical protein
MRYFYGFFTLCSFLLLSACGESAPGDAADTGEADTTATQRGLTEAPAVPPCQVEGRLLEDNWLHLREKELLLAIVADSTTRSENLGPSHRVLEIYDASTCEPLERHILPVNKAADYAYQIAQITYNNESQLVGLHAFDAIYVYDVANRRLLPELKPAYKAERYGVDAQSGQIQRLEVWEHYLVGYAQDFGAFVFDFSDKRNPRPVLPFADYPTPEDEFHSLFLLPSDSEYQALLPVYRQASDDFEVNPLLPEPAPVDLAQSVIEDRYAVLRLEPGALAVDLQQRQRVPLPPDLETMPMEEIVQWLREREN